MALSCVIAAEPDESDCSVKTPGALFLTKAEAPVGLITDVGPKLKAPLFIIDEFAPLKLTIQATPVLPAFIVLLLIIEALSPRSATPPIVAGPEPATDSVNPLLIVSELVISREDDRVIIVVPLIVTDLQVDAALKTGIFTEAGMVTSVFEEGTPALQFPAVSQELSIEPSHVVDADPALLIIIW